MHIKKVVHHIQLTRFQWKIKSNLPYVTPKTYTHF